MQTFLQDGDEQINGDGAPDLDAHGVLTRAVEGFDAQMLLDPFEEQFDLPAALIQLRDGQRWHSEVVGQKDQMLAGLGIAIADAAQRVGIMSPGIVASQYHGLIKEQAGVFIHRTRVAASAEEVFLGAGDEEGRTQVQPMQAREVQIAAIHDVKRARLPNEFVKDVHVVDAARRDNNDGGEVAMQSQKGVQFDGGFATAETGPREERQTQINGGGVQRVGGGLQFNAEGLVSVEGGGLLDENMSEVGEDAPVPGFIGVGQGAAGDGVSKARVIKLRTESGQTSFDVAETFAPGQLSESQDEKLFVSGEFADAEVAVVMRDALVELVFGEEVEELGEDGATFVHKVKNRRNAGSHPQRTVAELKSKKTGTAKTTRNYRDEIAVSQILTGHYWSDLLFAGLFEDSSMNRLA